MAAKRLQRVALFLLLLFLSLAALADGMVVPSTAYPAKVTIPDQRALICYSNGIERLVIETRFTGSGTNFAWIVPLPAKPLIEEATTGLFPTLQFLFRPEIIHNVPRYYLGVLAVVTFFFLLWLRNKFGPGFGVFSLLFLFLFMLVMSALLLPVASISTRSLALPAPRQSVSVLDRKIVGILDTAAIASSDPKALENWLMQNGYSVPPGSAPVIEDYVKKGWVFAAAKVRGNVASEETLTPQPLSFQFKTPEPVYPMRLTGLDNRPLSVDLYVFSTTPFEAPYFKLESCTRPTIVHPLLRQWTRGLPMATKLSATLTPDDMREDIWLKPSAVIFEKNNSFYSPHGAGVTAINWGSELFGTALACACFLALVSRKCKAKLPRLICISVIAGVALAGVSYLCLPKTDVRLVRGPAWHWWLQQQMGIRLALADSNPSTLAEARADIRQLASNPTNAAAYGIKNWNNSLIGGPLREEDSPGNYLLSETNNQLQLTSFNSAGGEQSFDIGHLQSGH